MRKALSVGFQQHHALLIDGLVAVVRAAPTPLALTNGRLFKSVGSLGCTGLTQASFGTTLILPPTPSTVFSHR
jgi:hypothetical protein